MSASDSTTSDPKQPPIGIDLGTTYSVIAFLDASGRPSTIPNEAGDLLTPSAVAFDDETVLVGKEAVKSAVFEPSVFADCFKRDIGRREFHRPIADNQVPPEVLSAFVLRKLKEDAERSLSQPITQAVVTVPAFFDETRRRATREAGRLAGLEVLDIINEPTAAAVAFGYYRTALKSHEAATKPQRIVVYDLGGGTFDVTVLEIDGQTFRALATDGDVQLGGRDFDERLVNRVAEEFIAAHNVDPRSEPHDAAQLWQDVQGAKHTLCQRTSVAIPCNRSGIRMRTDITRGEFEGLTADLLERTETTTQLVLRQAKLDWPAIDRVLLVGGSTRMPMVAEMLKRATGKEPDRSISPDEAVAHGAALYAGTLMAEPGSRRSTDFTLVNVNSHSLGVVGIDQRAKCERNVVLIPKNTALPCRAARRFSTARENQGNVRVMIVEGESENPEHCIKLGDCVVRNLPPGLPKGTKVEVEYRYSTDGCLSVRARVPVARQSATVEIQYEKALHIPDLDTWHNRVCRIEDSDEPSEVLSLEEGVNRLVSRLDDLFVAFGEQASTMRLPASFKGRKATALAAAREVQAATAKLIVSEKKRQAAVGQSEILGSSAALSKASIAAGQAEAAARSAYRALAEDCIAAEFAPGPLEALYSEIKHLQAA